MKKQLYAIVLKLWEFIKDHLDIPTQSDNASWDRIVSESNELVKDHQTSDPIDRLFVAWVVAYLQYMSDVSKGIPTLMQEAKEVAKEV